MAETETKETDSKAHEGAEPSPFEAEEKKSPKKIAEDYMIPMSDGALKEWAGKEGFAEYAAMVAQGLYPPLAKQISVGLTTKILLDPYVQIAKKTLGDQVEPKWDDPLWQTILEGTPDSKSGRATLMSLKDWETHLKTSPDSGFGDTEKGKDLAKAFADHVDAGHGKWDGTQGGMPLERPDIPNMPPIPEVPEGAM